MHRFIKSSALLLPRAMFLLLLTILLSGPASGRSVELRFDSEDPAATPFPSDLFTAAAPERLTGRRVALPFPDCAEQATQCELIHQLNTLDGFNLQPRLSLPFSAPIDPLSVGSDNVFLLRLGASSHELTRGGSGPVKVGIDQLVWDPESNTLHVEAGAQLDQRRRYALIVTTGVRDTQGRPISRRAFSRFLVRMWRSAETRDYARSLLSASIAAFRH
ncbi:MAG: hypothetical protein MI919_38675, partial [Holophagales bacterium]|nr:hypothetical protein [Holophagales bacterium]